MYMHICIYIHTYKDTHTHTLAPIIPSICTTTYWTQCNVFVPNHLWQSAKCKDNQNNHSHFQLVPAHAKESIAFTSNNPAYIFCGATVYFLRGCPENLLLNRCPLSHFSSKPCDGLASSYWSQGLSYLGEAFNVIVYCPMGPWLLRMGKPLYEYDP